MLTIIDKPLTTEDGTPLDISVKAFPLMSIREVAKTLPQIIEPHFNDYNKMWVDYNSDFGTLLITINGYKDTNHNITLRYEIYSDCVNFMKWRVTKSDASYFNFIQSRSGWLKCETVHEMIHQMATAYAIGSTDSPTIKRLAKEI